MRNITEHPITEDEKIRALRWAVQQATETHDQRGFGDTTVAALSAVLAEQAPNGSQED